MIRARFLAHGRVQGVGFRDFVCRIGNSIGLSGYAKNLPDGSVEIVAEGEAKKIEELKKRISVRQPFGIHVEKISEAGEKETASPSFSSFSVEF